MHSNGTVCSSLETGKLLQDFHVCTWKKRDVALSQHQQPSSAPAPRSRGTRYCHQENDVAPSAAPLSVLQAPCTLLRRTFKAPRDN